MVFPVQLITVTDWFMIFQTFIQNFKKEEKLILAISISGLFPRLTIWETTNDFRTPCLTAPCTAPSQHEVCWEAIGPFTLHKKRGCPCSLKKHRLQVTSLAGHQPPCKEYGFKEDPHLWEIIIALTDSSQCNYSIYVLKKFKNYQKIAQLTH